MGYCHGVLQHLVSFVMLWIHCFTCWYGKVPNVHFVSISNDWGGSVNYTISFVVLFEFKLL